MQTKHTPGPWTFIESDDARIPDRIIGANGAPVVSGSIVGRDDAALIASAPDLLAALEAADAWVAMYHDEPGHDAASRCMTKVIRAAIAKATGSQQ